MMRRTFIALALAGGCTGSTAPLPYQGRYVDYVWRERYGMIDAPPEIEWLKVEPWTIAGADYDGFTWAGWKVQVAYGSDGSWPIEGTALAHELFHERTFERTGDVDAFHWRGDWTWESKVESDAVAVMQQLRATNIEKIEVK